MRSGRNARAIRYRRLLLPVWIFLTASSVAATFYFSSQPVEVSSSVSMRLLGWLLRVLPLPSLPGNMDLLHHFLRKLAHFTLYFLMGFGLTGLYSYWRRVPVVPAVLVTGAAYAALDEFHQSFVKGRGPGVSDVILDTGGVAVACVLFLLISFALRGGASGGPRKK